MPSSLSLYPFKLFSGSPLFIGFSQNSDLVPKVDHNLVLTFPNFFQPFPRRNSQLHPILLNLLLAHKYLPWLTICERFLPFVPETNRNGPSSFPSSANHPHFFMSSSHPLPEAYFVPSAQGFVNSSNCQPLTCAVKGGSPWSDVISTRPVSIVPEEQGTVFQNSCLLVKSERIPCHLMSRMTYCFQDVSKELAIQSKLNSFNKRVPKPVFASESSGDLNTDSRAHSRPTESKLGGKGEGMKFETVRVYHGFTTYYLSNWTSCLTSLCLPLWTGMIIVSHMRLLWT